MKYDLTIKSIRFFIGIRGISQLGSAFTLCDDSNLRVQVTSLHRWNMRGINRKFL